MLLMLVEKNTGYQPSVEDIEVARLIWVPYCDHEWDLAQVLRIHGEVETMYVCLDCRYFVKPEVYKIRMQSDEIAYLRTGKKTSDDHPNFPVRFQWAGVLL